GSAAPALIVATDVDLTALTPGTGVAIVGYPSESMAGPRDNHVAQTISGEITALTSAFQQPAASADAILVHHNLPRGGGSSGSRFRARCGGGVASQWAGNVPAGAKGRLPIGTGYAQRIDLLREMLAGGAETNQWARQLAWTAELHRIAPSPEVLLS